MYVSNTCHDTRVIKMSKGHHPSDSVTLVYREQNKRKKNMPGTLEQNTHTSQVSNQDGHLVRIKNTQ